jgi:hypothetical protein
MSCGAVCPVPADADATAGGAGGAEPEHPANRAQHAPVATAVHQRSPLTTVLATEAPSSIVSDVGLALRFAVPRR